MLIFPVTDCGSDGLSFEISRLTDIPEPEIHEFLIDKDLTEVTHVGLRNLTDGTSGNQSQSIALIKGSDVGFTADFYIKRKLVIPKLEDTSFRKFYPKVAEIDQRAGKPDQILRMAITETNKPAQYYLTMNVID